MVALYQKYRWDPAKTKTERDLVFQIGLEFRRRGLSGRRPKSFTLLTAVHNDSCTRRGLCPDNFNHLLMLALPSQFKVHDLTRQRHAERTTVIFKSVGNYSSCRLSGVEIIEGHYNYQEKALGTSSVEFNDTPPPKISTICRRKDGVPRQRRSERSRSSSLVEATNLCSEMMLRLLRERGENEHPSYYAGVPRRPFYRKTCSYQVSHTLAVHCCLQEKRKVRRIS